MVLTVTVTVTIVLVVILSKQTSSGEPNRTPLPPPPPTTPLPPPVPLDHIRIPIRGIEFDYVDMKKEATVKDLREHCGPNKNNYDWFVYLELNGKKLENAKEDDQPVQLMDIIDEINKWKVDVHRDNRNSVKVTGWKSIKHSKDDGSESEWDIAAFQAKVDFKTGNLYREDEGERVDYKFNPHEEMKSFWSHYWRTYNGNKPETEFNMEEHRNSVPVASAPRWIRLRIPSTINNAVQRTCY